jgi:hypothetical protein
MVQNVFEKLANMRQPLENLATLLERTALAEFAPRLREQYRLANDTAVHVVVLGAFNQGKSTLINSLLGARVLPMALVPTTAYVTRIGYSPYPQAVLHYTDPKIPNKTVNIEDLADFLTIAESQKYAPLKQVEVLCPWRLAGQQELVLYDTPGFNDRAVQAEAARESLLRADLTIFMLDARHPLTETEVEVATGWLQGTFPIFLVNFLNLVDEDDHDRILERIRQGLSNHKLLFPELPFMVVNVLQGLKGRLNNNPKWVEQSGLTAFEATLQDFAGGSKQEKLLSATRWGRLQHILGDIYRANQAIFEGDSLKQAARQAAAQEYKIGLEKFQNQVDDVVNSIQKLASREIVVLEFNLVNDLERVTETASVPALQNALQTIINNHLTEWLFHFERLANLEWSKLRNYAKSAPINPLKLSQLSRQPLDVPLNYNSTPNQPPRQNPAFNRDKPLESLGGMAQDMGRQIGTFFGGITGGNSREEAHRQNQAREQAKRSVSGLVTRLCANIEQNLAVEVQRAARQLKDHEIRDRQPPTHFPPSPLELTHREIEKLILRLIS